MLCGLLHCDEPAPAATTAPSAEGSSFSSGPPTATSTGSGHAEAAASASAAERKRGAPDAISAKDASLALPSDQRVRITLKDPGAEPRAPLIYSAEAGDKQSVQIAATITNIVERQPVKTELRFEVLTEVTQVIDQRYGIKLTVTAAESAPVLLGKHTMMLVSKRGVVEPIELPRGLDDQGRQLWASVGEMMRDSIVQLPEAAVGVGAKWDALDRIWRGGAALLRTTRYTLEERGDAKSRVRGVVTEQPVVEGARDPALPSELSLKAISGISAGKRRVAWRGILPTAAESDIASDLQLEVKVKGADASVQSVRLTQVLLLVAKPQ